MHHLFQSSIYGRSGDDTAASNCKQERHCTWLGSALNGCECQTFLEVALRVRGAGVQVRVSTSVGQMA